MSAGASRGVRVVAAVSEPVVESEGNSAAISSNATTRVDGPYAEAKDLVSGVLVVSAASLEAAVELARGCPIYEYDGSVEVRPLRVLPPPASK